MALTNRRSLEGHQRILRSAFAWYHGHKVDTQGDSFLVAFQRASDAVQAATQAQRELASNLSWNDNPVRVRMAEWTAGRSMSMEEAIRLAVEAAA